MDSLAILEKAVRIARATREEIQPVVTVGHNPSVAPSFISVLFFMHGAHPNQRVCGEDLTLLLPRATSSMVNGLSVTGFSSPVFQSPVFHVTGFSSGFHSEILRTKGKRIPPRRPLCFDCGCCIDRRIPVWAPAPHSKQHSAKITFVRIEA
jgi:hypothetical protein